jgi:hypothetical protein
MILFDPNQARHFCALAAVPAAGQVQSLAHLHDALPRHVNRLQEGTANYEAHRASLLFAVERWLLFGITQYRRALDMFIPCGAPWAQVTLYYSSFYAANAILGMFGAWQKNALLVDVDNGVPTQQTLRINRRARSPSGYDGSHRVFWDFFYEGCNHLSPWVPARMMTATQPVNNNRAWQSEERNLVNYDTLQAYEAAIRFQASFRPQRVRTTLSGPLLQQLVLSEGLLELALHFMVDLKLPEYALSGFGIQGARSRVFRNLVTSVPPSIVTQSRLQTLLP